MLWQHHQAWRVRGQTQRGSKAVDLIWKFPGKQGATVTSRPEAIGRLPRLQSKLPTPPGMPQGGDHKQPNVPMPPRSFPRPKLQKGSKRQRPAEVTDLLYEGRCLSVSLAAAGPGPASLHLYTSMCQGSGGESDSGLFSPFSSKFGLMALWVAALTQTGTAVPEGEGSSCDLLPEGNSRPGVPCSICLL